MDEFKRLDRMEDDLRDQEDPDMVETDLSDDDPSVFNPARQADDEETAAELTADDLDDTPSRIETDDDDETNVNSAYGWVALALSIISFFWMPVILGAAGIIVGFIARGRGANTLGMTAIIAGAASIIISLFILPFV
ncbi:DUF4190 domain-containing protein [Lentibacillus sp. L22]|uniref:DUF4190 domain-containing protein n=1 Tax=Lentibacillus TaxID=175304 RepID=UPI0022B15A49|nr:DUF4190 domain-containing protein [Lentibacillus daqui]